MVGQAVNDSPANSGRSKLFAFAPAARYFDIETMIFSSAETRSEAAARVMEAMERAEADLIDELNDAEASEAVPRNDRLLVAAQMCQAIHLTMLTDPALAFTDVPRPVVLLVMALSDTVHGSRPEVVHSARHPVLPPQQVLVLQDLPLELSQKLSFGNSVEEVYDRLCLHLWRLKAAVSVPHLQLGVLTETASAIADYCDDLLELSPNKASLPAVALLMSDLVIALREWMDRRRSHLLHESWTENVRGRPVVLYRDLGRAIVVAAYTLLLSAGVKPREAGQFVENEMAAAGLEALISEGRGARMLGKVRADHIRCWSRRLASSNPPLGWMKEIHERIIAEVTCWRPFLTAGKQSSLPSDHEMLLANKKFTARVMVCVAGSFWLN